MPSVLRIKNPDGTWYEVTALKGDTGITPNLQVGTVTTGNPGTSAEVTITGTPEEPVLNFKIPKGEPGTGGGSGSGTVSYINYKGPDDAGNVALAAGDVGAVPDTRRVNSKPLSTDIELSAEDIGARPDTWTPTASDVNAVPTTRKVNDKPLSSDITLIASDVGALAQGGTAADSSKLGGHDPSHYATTEDIQQVRNEIPTKLPNPNALTINGQSYDGSSEVSVEIPAGGGSAYELPIASATQLGGVKPVAKTDEMTQEVGVDEAGGLWTVTGHESGSGVDIVYPMQTTAYNAKLTEYMQKLADEAGLINTSSENLSHSVLVAARGRIVVFAFIENDTAGATSDDCSLSTSVHCKGRILVDKSPIKNVYQNNFIGDSGIFYLFTPGETVYDTSETEVGVVAASTGASVTSVDDNNYHINARVRLDDGRVIHAHRMLEVSYTVTNSGNTITVSYTLGNITNTTLTVDGVTGDNDLSRVNSAYSGIVYSGCGFQYNVDDGKAYTARVISGSGVVICATSDFVDFQFVAFYPFSGAYIEASLFFDVSWKSSKEYEKQCVYVACRQNYGVNYTRIAKLDYANNYAVLDEVDVPSATSRPMWSSSRYKGDSFLDYNCFLLLGDYNREYLSVYKIVDRNIRNLKPVAKVYGKCSNYSVMAERETSTTWLSSSAVIIAGTNGTATDFGGISFIACKMADGKEDFTSIEPYTKTEIDEMLGRYVSDVAALVGGDA